jgi:hypothetical protein
LSSGWVVHSWRHGVLRMSLEPHSSLLLPARVY